MKITEDVRKYAAEQQPNERRSDRIRIEGKEERIRREGF